MQLFIVVLLICFVIFLFSLYTFSHDDFVLLRRNISTDDMFNFAFEVGIVSLIFSRIFYVVFHPRPVFFNPLGFLLFPYFPGLSVVGGAVGAILFFLFIFRKEKFPKGRVFDFFSMSFLSAAPFGLLGYMFLARDFSFPTIIELILYLLFFLGTVFIFMPRIVKSGKRDGIIGLIFLIFFSLITFLHDLFGKTSLNLRFLNHSILIIIFAVSVALLLKHVLKISFPKK